MKVQATESPAMSSTVTAVYAAVFGFFTNKEMRSLRPLPLSVIIVAVTSSAGRFSQVMRISVRP